MVNRELIETPDFRIVDRALFFGGMTVALTSAGNIGDPRLAVIPAEPNILWEGSYKPEHNDAAWLLAANTAYDLQPPNGFTRLGEMYLQTRRSVLGRLPVFKSWKDWQDIDSQPLPDRALNG